MPHITGEFDGGSDAEFTRFLSYAQRPVSKVVSSLYVTLDHDYILKEQFQDASDLSGEIRRF